MAEIPDWVRPVSPCETRTQNRYTRDRHGVKRTEVRLPVDPGTVTR